MNKPPTRHAAAIRQIKAMPGSLAHKILLTYNIAMAAAADAANRRMLSEGRTVWNDDDWNTMCAEFERLKPQPKVSDSRSAQDQYMDSID